VGLTDCECVANDLARRFGGERRGGRGDECVEMERGMINVSVGVYYCI
jgi:hypothetical protein